MTNKGKNSGTSAFERETKENFNQIIEAINSLRQDFTKRFDKIEKEQSEIKQDLTDLKNYVEVQFEAVRQGIVKNYNKFESRIADCGKPRGYFQLESSSWRTARKSLSFNQINRTFS